MFISLQAEETSGIVNRNRGSALILALGILVVVSLFTNALLGLAGIEMRMAEQFAARSKAHYAALAGIEVAISELVDDGNGYDALTEEWRETSAYRGELGSWGFYDVSWKVGVDGQMVNGVEDEAAKININVMDKEILINLPGINGKLADAIISYREKKPFFSVEEMLLIEGLTPGIFNKIEKLITVNSNGKVNVNTAPPEVLNCLGLKGEFIDDLLSHRRGEDMEDGTADDNPFEEMKEVFSLGDGHEVNPEVISSLLDVRSNNFLIISTGKVKVGKRRYIGSKIKAVVERKDTGDISIKYWWEN